MDNQDDLIIFFSSPREVELQLIRDKATIDTISVWPADSSLVDKEGIDFHFDTMLVSAVDKILKRNTIEKLPLKEVQVAGEADPTSVFLQVALAVAAALKTRK
ncbi:MAG: hypothetical protein A3C88_02795 [Candidatus Yanofskybacteria bacterium RIFCSPHIGHO2_02_FULL_50_12]|uniref:Uncharacterized protein n=1 Tax=Candidatus Yanofskybacteria bacterium RIFCSPHIGHO2_02_FULL_50_12 TaxID=1802685 RepID=A0A1F8FVS0_9BACT|nr:MAG: hypothetical protein A3C88_02795 [Candidatus Yanofskybacteria bacterium RIFCSPHIGHO2_02_FULL_50_12]